VTSSLVCFPSFCHTPLARSVSTIAITITIITSKLTTLIAQAILNTSQASIRDLCLDKLRLAPEPQIFSSRATLVEGDSTDLAVAPEAVRSSQVAICYYLGIKERRLLGQQCANMAAVFTRE
jgi:hypothetical protein